MNEKTKQALENIKSLKNVEILFPKSIKIVETALNDYDMQNKILKEHVKELIKEQNRLFDIAKENDKAMEIIAKNLIDIHDIVVYSTFSAFNQHRTLRGLTTITQNEFDFVMKVVEKYGK